MAKAKPVTTLDTQAAMGKNARMNGCCSPARGI